MTVAMMSAFGVKRTWPIAVQMSAFDPKRNFGLLDHRPTRFQRRRVRYSPLALGGRE
jgi:hypothetical protein